MLFDPARHEPLHVAEWDPALVREAVRSIVGDLEQDRTAAGQWRVHPLDDEGDEPRGGFKSIYLGSAGVLWALWYLQRQGAVELSIDPASAIDAVHADYLASPDTGEVTPSYFLGEAGILLVRWRLTGAAATAVQLARTVRASLKHRPDDPMYGAPGTLLAALHVWRATADDRWRALFREIAEPLLRSERHEKSGYLGIAHGYVGRIYPLLEGASLLADADSEALFDRCAGVLRSSAMIEDGAVNWPIDFAPIAPDAKRLLQWCHGAPGIVVALARFPLGRSPELEALLAGAGEAIWSAGPVAKGPGLCHGTSGNGSAFLALHRRTGHPRWLARARAFAMHAIEQRARMRHAHGRPRATLWTGDAGLALYLWQCLQGAAGFPMLEFV